MYHKCYTFCFSLPPILPEGTIVGVGTLFSEEPMLCTLLQKYRFLPLYTIVFTCALKMEVIKVEEKEPKQLASLYWKQETL